VNGAAVAIVVAATLTSASQSTAKGRGEAALGAPALLEQAAQDFARARVLIEANCGDCAGATRQGLLDGIAAMEQALVSGLADRAAGLRLLASAYNTLAHVHAAPDSAEEKSALGRRVGLLEEIVALAPRDATARYDLAMALDSPARTIAGLREILVFAPAHEDARFALAMTLYREGETDEPARLLAALAEAAGGERQTLYRNRLAMVLGQPQRARFSGEVTRGQHFERAFGHGLVFRLAASGDQATPGWTIEVRPAGEKSPEVELSWPVTPPHRFWNPRYLDASYGYTAAQAVAMSPRQFSFLKNPGDYPRTSAAVRTLLWPGGVADSERDRAEALLRDIPTCAGDLWIVEHRIDGNAIEWLRFEVDLCR
jgi:hypothetical protein